MAGSGVRLAGAIVLGVLLVAGTAAAATAWLWTRDGMVRIEVDEGPGGDRVSLSAPAWLLRVAALEGIDLRLDSETERWLPAVRSALDSWDEHPDGVVVRTGGPDGEVVVTKDGPRLVLSVRDGSDRVRIEVPARAAARLIPAAGS